MAISLQQTYASRQILLLGGMGFLGKVLLALFLQKLPDIGHIYLVLRGTRTEEAEQRFEDCFANSPIFETLRHMRHKITVLNGDVSLPHFGLQNPPQNIDLVINSAGLVAFNPKLHQAVDANLKGAIHAAEFVKASKQASLLHISTCYVAGNQSGHIPEELSDGRAPNGKPFDVIQELKEIENLSREAAIKRANDWGWPNIYTYTKAMSESWLALQNIPCAIVRPSIVESSLEFPFPGWNEGYNTSAPLVQSTQGWYPFVLAKQDFPMDIIPVDILCKQIVKIGAQLLSDSHEPLYQCATSARNPLYMKQVLTFTRQKQRETAKTWKEKLKVLLKLRTIHPTHPLSSLKLSAQLSKLKPRSKLLRKTSRHLSRLAKLHETFLPFIYENRFIFVSDLADKIIALEPEFNITVDQINWPDYWLNIHMPGLERWCFPKIEQP